MYWTIGVRVNGVDFVKTVDNEDEAIDLFNDMAVDTGEVVTTDQPHIIQPAMATVTMVSMERINDDQYGESQIGNPNRTKGSIVRNQRTGKY